METHKPATLASSNGLKFRGKEKKRQMNTDIIFLPVRYDSAVEATWGMDSSVLWQPSGKVQGFVCLWGVG